jgi:hypothetical protein
VYSDFHPCIPVFFFIAGMHFDRRKP